MTFLEVENLLKETTHALYPVVVTREQPYIVGQVQRRDLQIVLSMFNAMKIAFYFKLYNLESQKMQRYRLSSYIIEFTSQSEAVSNSDYDSDHQVEQRTTINNEVIRVGNLLDQV